MLKCYWRKVLLCSCLFATLIVLSTGLATVIAKSPTEAPAGFNTPSFNGAQSVSNGIVEPSGDTFAKDQEVYEENHYCNYLRLYLVAKHGKSGERREFCEGRGFFYEVFRALR